MSSQGTNRKHKQTPLAFLKTMNHLHRNLLVTRRIAHQLGSTHKHLRRKYTFKGHNLHAPVGHRFASSLNSPNTDSSNAEPTNILSDIWNVAPSIVEHVHTSTGLPWWATFAACTVSMRISLLPLLVYQVRSVASFTSGATGQQMHQLSALFQKSLADAKTQADRSNALKLYWKGLRGIWRMNKVHPAQCIAVPLVQIPLMITFMWSTRQMIKSGEWDLTSGGALWFSDLSIPDQTLLLPVAAVGLTYASLERSFGRSKDIASISQIAREILQTGLVISFPFIAHLPGGIFMYWIPSSVFVLVQSFFLRQPTVQRLMLMGVDLRPPPSVNTNPNRVPFPLLVPGREAKPKLKKVEN